MVGVASYPVPIPTAYGRGMTVEDQLLIGEQAFTLRLGTLAALPSPWLRGYGSPGTATAMMTTLAGLAAPPDYTYRGCAAIDHALCARFGEAPGCLVNACGTGMTAFAGILDQAFDAVDGAGLDLTCQAPPPSTDTHDDGVAGRIGVLPEDASGTDAWRVELHTAT